MTNTISKYFAGELSPEEKELFLSEICKSVRHTQLFIETQQLLAYMDFAQGKRNEENARQSLSRFIQKTGKKLI
jgi:hypothetical protein